MARMPSIDVEINVTERPSKPVDQPSALVAVGRGLTLLAALVASWAMFVGVAVFIRAGLAVAARIVGAVLP